MLGSTSFFRFSVERKWSDGTKRRLAVAYKPPGPLLQGAIEELMADVCAGPLLPDAVVILSLTEEAGDDFVRDLTGESSRIARERLAGRIPLFHSRYSLESGRVDTTLCDALIRRNLRDWKRVASCTADELLCQGLRELFCPEVVVLTAPPGYEYEKPSGARSSYFLKPDLALTSSAAVAFVGLGVFDRMFVGQPERASTLQTVFVDTMAIAPVAYALRDLLELRCADARRRPYLIESFHSYGGFDEVRRPFAGTSICLISASTSMAMHERWITKKEAPPTEVLTLVTAQPVAKFRSGALVDLEMPEAVAAKGPPQLTIKIRGESFLPAQEPPKHVLLREAVHKSADIEPLTMFTAQGVFDVYRKAPHGSQRLRAIHVDGSKLIEHAKFEEWLESQLQQRTKACTRYVVHQEDQASKTLARKVASFCEQRLGLTKLLLLSAAEAPSRIKAKEAGAIVCAAVTGNGSQLLQVSRSLRDVHHGPRLYLIGYQVAETGAQVAALPMDLRHSKGVVPHEVAVFAKASVGTQLVESFNKEVETFYDSSVELSKVPRGLRDRARLLRSSKPLAGLALLPHGPTLMDAMQLREGFAYWRGYQPGPHHAEVLATVAVLLQRARDDRELKGDHSLSSASFRQVMLSPQNFTRYNDGVIQAALLRNAFPSELDYRSDRAASEYMANVVRRAVERANTEAGEAALEFLLSLALGRLQLMPADFDRVLDCARSATHLTPALQGAISFILAPLAGQRKRQAKLPF